MPKNSQTIAQLHASHTPFIPGSGAPSELPCHAPFLILHLSIWVSQAVLVVKSPPVNAGDVRDTSCVRKIPWRRHGNPLQHSCLGNSMDRGASWATSPCGYKQSNMTEWVLSALYSCQFLHLCMITISISQGCYKGWMKGLCDHWLWMLDY